MVEKLQFKSTKSLPILDGILGQERAQEAVRYAMSMTDSGYNLYAVGRNGLGKRTMVLRYLNQHTGINKDVSDWCYVANFSEPRNPQVLKLPAGIGQKLKDDMEKLLARLVKTIPLSFDNDEYYERSEKLKNELAEMQEKALEKLVKQAKRKKVNLTITTPGGYRLVAMNGDEPHSVESFEKLTKEDQDNFESVISKLEIQLRALLRRLSGWEQDYTDKQQQLNEEVVLSVTSHLIESLQEKYWAHKEVVQYFNNMQKDIVDNLDIFLEDSDEQAAFAYAALDKKMPRRYQVNLLVSRKNASIPVIVEESPNYHNLFGYVENVTYKGTVFTDFSLIRPGSFHRANGGYLLMDADKVLEQPFVWDGLKRALRSSSLNITSLEREVTLSGTISIEPEAIPLDVKIILFGDRETLLLLQHYDPEFKELFKITVDFENEMPRTYLSERQYAQFLASLVREKGLRHCDAKAVARIIEFSSRKAEHQDKLSLHAAEIANLLRESNFWAKESNSNMIRSIHVERALESQQFRDYRIKDEMFESFKQGTTLLTVEGKTVGQINALSVLGVGGIEFGMPNRVTATSFYGEGAVIDIERDSKLSGNIHSKGVLILSSYLASLFSKKEPMHLSASITFEQSYGEVDGDSASMAEFIALISSFSNIPVRQDLAITGSMNQFGETQPIGGVNEKIEGFYDTCKILGLTGRQGVIIPKLNTQNLMLNTEILTAVNRGQFHIYVVEHVTEAIQLLTGMAAGSENDEGCFSVDSVYGKVQMLLDELREEEKEDEKPEQC
jgi:lon-related putative ATP-dependent protease